MDDVRASGETTHGIFRAWKQPLEAPLLVIPVVIKKHNNNNNNSLSKDWATMNIAQSSTHTPQLPPGWIAVRDRATGRTYYANPTTGQGSCEPPSSSVPPPPPPPPPQSAPRPRSPRASLQQTPLYLPQSSSSQEQQQPSSTADPDATLNRSSFVPRTMMRPYELPREHIFPQVDFDYEFEKLCKEEKVNAVNHGEFERAADQIFAITERNDAGKLQRCPVLAIQRCRRGGKTFMLHAVARILCNKRLHPGTHVILISLNSETKYMEEESPYVAILSRIAYAWERILGENRFFREFRKAYSDFAVVDEWLHKHNAILLIDELNVLPPEGSHYDDMSHMLDELAGRKGSAVMYSTHHRSYADILRGRTGTSQFRLSTRQHLFLPIPRVRNRDCLEGLQSNAAKDPSLWSAVLRGRIPCLILTSYTDIAGFAEISFEREASVGMDQTRLEYQELLEERALTRRIMSLASAVTGKVVDWDGHATRDEFKAYSYMTDRKGSDGKFLYAWPPFLLASENVLGKEYRMLYETLCSPEIDEAKAFEALAQLAVLLRLLSSQPHELVPHLNLRSHDAFEATEMYHVSEEAQDLDGLIKKVTERYALLPGVRQVVVVPLFASFPVYDFFLFHRNEGKWVSTAGYQCKVGNELPDEQHRAMESVGLSVWIRGSCRKYRVEAGTRVSQTKRRGWVVMKAEKQFDMLGVSISEALPHHATSLSDLPCQQCDAEKSPLDRRDAVNAGNKRLKFG